MPRPRKGKRVLGPYPHRDGWQVHIVDEEGGRDPFYFTDKEEAKTVAKRWRQQLGLATEMTLLEAIDAYEFHLRDDKGNKPKSVSETIRRIKAFLSKYLDDGLRSVDNAKAVSAYESAINRPKRYGKSVDCDAETPAPKGYVKVKKDGSWKLVETVAADTQRNEMLEVRSFFRWCHLEKKWTTSNPLEGVRGKGRRRHGKTQLRVDELRKWFDKAYELGEAGDAGAVAAMMTLLLAVSGKEVTDRVVRDVDAQGTLLWIEQGKTEKRNGAVEVPELLRPFLLKLIEGKTANQFLFATKKGGKHWRDWPRENVRRICKLVNVPLVSAHSMRGVHASRAYERGATGHIVAEGLRHTHESVSKQSYATPEAIKKGQQEKVLALLGERQKGSEVVCGNPSNQHTEEGEDQKP
jgi:integrase